MNHPFLHLLWKSYRSQRQIWLTMLCAMVVFQFLVAAIVQHTESPSTHALLVGLTITLAFLGISTLAMFLMEEELETAHWLRLLPIKWWHQLSAGVVCAAGLTATLAAVGIADAVVVNILCSSQFDPIIFDYLLGKTWGLLLSIWLAALAASIMFRRVLIVLPLTAFTAIFCVSMFDFQVTWPLTGICLILLCSLPILVPRWQLGRFQWPRWISSPASWFSQDRVQGKAKLSWRTRFLKRAAAADGMTQRTTRVLFWQELVYAIPFGLAMLTVGIAIVVFFRAEGTHLLLLFIWLFAFALECGLRTFRHDQKKQNGLFWAHRGISPVKIWLIKNCVWMPLMLSVAFFVTWLDAPPAHHLAVQFQVEWMLTRFADPLAGPGLASPPYSNGSSTSASHILAALLLMGYFVSQLFSAWLRRPIVASAVAFVALISLPQWTYLCQSNDVPLILSTWPIIAACALATVVSKREWMDRRQNAWIWAKRLAVFALLPIGMWVGYQIYRTTQLTSGDLRLALIEDRFEKARKESPLSKAELDNPSTDRLWLALMNKAGGSAVPFASSADNSTEIAKPAADKQLSQAGQVLTQIVETKDWNSSRLPIQIRTNMQGVIAETLTRTAVGEAERLVKRQRSDLAFDVLLKAERLTEYLAAQSSDWSHFNECMEAVRTLHQHLHWCASSDQVSREQLVEASEQFSRVKPYTDEEEMMLDNRDRLYFDLLDSDFAVTKQETILANDYAKLSRADMVRHQQLIRLSRMLTYFTRLSNDRFSDHEVTTWRRQLARWAETTPAFSLADDPMLDPWRTLSLEFQSAAMNSHHATWWVFQMQIYRREFGGLPTEFELRSWLRENGQGPVMRALYDWQTNEPYDLRLQGNGVASVLYAQRSGHILDPRQPIIGGPTFLFVLDEDESDAQLSAMVESKPMPFHPNRVIYIESTYSHFAVPPVSGELAAMIGAKPAAKQSQQGDFD